MGALQLLSLWLQQLTDLRRSSCPRALSRQSWWRDGCSRWQRGRGRRGRLQWEGQQGWWTSSSGRRVVWALDKCTVAQMHKCTVAQLHKCTLEKSPMQSTTLRLLALQTPLVLARSQDLTALEKMVKLANWHPGVKLTWLESTMCDVEIWFAVSLTANAQCTLEKCTNAQMQNCTLQKSRIAQRTMHTGEKHNCSKNVWAVLQFSSPPWLAGGADGTEHFKVGQYPNLQIIPDI